MFGQQHARAIKVGTDCSGMEAPLRALKQLNVPFSYEFGCDINQHCKAQCQASGCAPKRWHTSIFDRDCTTVPAVDLYVAGFPCQPHSTAGARRGGGDPRSQVFEECAKYINTHNPAVFLLENVKGIMSVQKGQMWQHILSTLRDSGDVACNIFYTVLNRGTRSPSTSSSAVYTRLEIRHSEGAMDVATSLAPHEHSGFFRTFSCARAFHPGPSP